ncbi:hypothetical protein SPRG_03193 [Saprolegnia parasitica CBS 223.65]|uniref:Uncharacterized protein n=1 Tax=Saprolegnia parasitica (strain CBS 223.65) TaxID=695850 RepID=A0A067CYU2_SAPPC|nr:hypothetical protein SPRG_03193 [Saprolegnia parasitica CBS 223.65]KDO31977.1 hypothetical protein SPRG_03193 [Saprolegnia parasitica CBS 223.65]|eukprot:XP_012197173.1 hypothetical protein SPRG_03193 [Saprolegnia parasitica CBS 223.65]
MLAPDSPVASLVRVQPLCRRDRHSTTELVKKAQQFSPVLARGFSTGNVAIVDKRSWLEVCDRKHRYGANLRAYYKEWKHRDGPKPDFWEWLSDESVEVEGVPRAKLEKETVLYYDKTERQKYALDIRYGLLHASRTQALIDTGEEGWIFVLRDGVLYGSAKVTKQTPRVHHTSFVGGECVQTAGILVIAQGVLTTIYPHSGHYRPSESEVLLLLRFLHEKGVRLDDVRVDVQRFQKVSRERASVAKVSKMANAHFWPALDVLQFLAAKEKAWAGTLFDDIEIAAKNRPGAV